MKGIAVLGSTGSIGQQTLDVVRALPDQLQIVALAAGQNANLLNQQIEEFHPRMVWLESGSDNIPKTDSLTVTPIEEMVRDPDVELVVVATTGRGGLLPTIEALRHGKSVALANKEVIIMAGELVTATASASGSPLLPVDSEPSAIWQCLRGEDSPPSRLIITASGGPFRKRPVQELAKVTPTEALLHPTWTMGRKITIDSATLMNKGFEVIESHWLFDMAYSQIDVIIHPQSVIHSMVEFMDGSVKAQIAAPDMRLPIQYAILYPDRVPNPSIDQFNPLQHPSLTFEPLDPDRYPCFKTALEVGRAGNTYPAVLSAVDEESVQLFLQERIAFDDIHRLICNTLDAYEPPGDNSLEAILEADSWARRYVHQVVDGL